MLEEERCANLVVASLHKECVQNTVVAFDNVNILAEVVNRYMNRKQPFRILLFQITIHSFLMLDELSDRAWAKIQKRPLDRVCASQYLGPGRRGPGPRGRRILQAIFEAESSQIKWTIYRMADLS